MSRSIRRIVVSGVSLLVLSTMLVSDVVWANPDMSAGSNHLSVPALTQRGSAGEPIRVDIQTKGTLLTAAKYLLGDRKRGIEPLPARRLPAVMRSELGSLADGFEFQNAAPKTIGTNTIWLIPFVMENTRYVAQIVLADSPAASGLAGDRWDITEDNIAIAVAEETPQVIRAKRSSASAVLSKVAPILLAGVIATGMTNCGSVREQDMNRPSYPESALPKATAEQDQAIDQALSDLSDEAKRDNAIKILNGIGKPAVRALIEKLRDSNWVKRLKAVEALGEINPPPIEAIEGLRECAPEPSDPLLFIPLAVADTMYRIDPSQGISYLIELLKENATDDLLRVLIHHALVEIGRPAVPHLKLALTDKDAYFRRSAANVLMDIGPDAKEAIPALKQALNDQNEDVRIIAAMAICLIDPSQNPPRVMTEQEREIKAAIAEFGDVDTFQRGVKTIARIGYPAIPAIAESLTNDNSIISTTSAFVLCKLAPGNKLAVPVLIKKLKDGQQVVRILSADALGNLGSMAISAVEPLTAALQDEDEVVRNTAKRALDKLKPLLDQQKKKGAPAEKPQPPAQPEPAIPMNDIKLKVKGGVEADIRTAELFDIIDRKKDENGKLANPERPELLSADVLLGAFFAMAVQAKRNGRKLVIGIETSWIPGINDKGSQQKSAIAALINEIDAIERNLAKLGLANVKIVKGNGQALADAVLKQAGSRDQLSNVVVLASNKTITDNFAPISEVITDEKERPFLAGVNTKELDAAYKKLQEEGGTASEACYIQLLSMLSLALGIATGAADPKNPLIASYDPKKRTIEFLPPATMMDIENLRRQYKGDLEALVSA